MGLKSLTKSFFQYFELDETVERSETEAAYAMPVEQPPMRPTSSRKVHDLSARRSKPTETRLDQLHDRQQELMANNEREIQKTTIDIKYPKRYEDAPEMVNLLLDNASILIDFQYMSEQQARRCLDYLDGARSVLSGNLKKVSSTMWLLTPVNVAVHIEELRQVNNQPDQDGSFDFDLKR